MASIEKMKMSSQFHDSDKDRNGTEAWLRRLVNTVGATPHGSIIHAFVLWKLDWQPFQPVTVSSTILNDPSFSSSDLQPAKVIAIEEVDDDDENGLDPVQISSPSGIAEALEAAAAADTAAGRATKARVLVKNTRYTEEELHFDNWPEKSKELDKALYHVLVHILKGSLNSLLAYVSRPSFVQAVVTLVEHLNLAESNRKTSALEGMFQLKHKGDVQRWELDCMKLIKELFESKCTIMDLALICVMKSLDGKSKTMQYAIAKDINGMKITDETNVFDMVQRYASEMAAVDGGVAKQVHFGTSNPPKRPEYKPALPKRGGKKPKSTSTRPGSKTTTKPKDKSKDRCNNCGELGHWAVDCDKPKREKPGCWSAQNHKKDGHSGGSTR